MRVRGSKGGSTAAFNEPPPPGPPGAERPPSSLLLLGGHRQRRGQKHALVVPSCEQEVVQVQVTLTHVRNLRPLCRFWLRGAARQLQTGQLQLTHPTPHHLKHTEGVRNRREKRSRSKVQSVKRR